MNINQLCSFLGCLTLCNFIFLLIFFFLVVNCKKLLYKVHHRFFKVTEEQINSSMYLLLGFYKLSIIFFNLIPYLALKCMV